MQVGAEFGTNSMTQSQFIMNEILIPVKSLSDLDYTHIAVSADYHKGSGIYLSVTPAKPVDMGCRYGICEFSHKFNILIESATRLTPTIKKHIVELNSKISAWQSQLADAYDRLHTDPDFSEAIKLWALEAPAIPPTTPVISDVPTTNGKWFFFFFDCE